MKKSGTKKSLSLKSAGTQKKISSFFIPSKVEKSNNAGRIKDEKNNAVKQNLSSKIVADRLPGENLCTRCLKKSPVLSSNICNDCNLVENVHQPTASIVSPNSSLIKLPHKIITCSLKDDILTSPDTIPATPPINNKHKSYIKQAKRKCSFENDIDSKKKNCPNSSKEHTKLTLKEISKPEPKLLKENKFVSNKNTNILKNISTNPICKPPVTVVTSVDQNICSLSEKDGGFVSCSGDSHETHQECTQSQDRLPRTTNKELFIKANDKVAPTEGPRNHENIVEATKKIKIVFENIPGSKTNTSPNDHSTHESNIFASVDSKENSVSNDEDVFSNYFDDSAFLEDVFKESVRLDCNTRCKVSSVQHLKDCGEVVMALTPCGAQDAGTDTVTCVLRGSWAGSNVSVGDVVSVSARPVVGQDGCWVVDDDGGLLVVHPDTLISGTTVVGSLFCMRRSVLSDMYRGIDSDSSIMIIGSFLHQLLQEVLKRKVSTLQDIEKVLEEFKKSRYFISNIYSSCMSLDKTMETLKEFIPKIHGFVQKYLLPESITSGRKTWDQENSWNGTIEDIADIEENIWSPSLGLKGKIDVTVKTSTKNYKGKVMPLELKTGRASFSAEHRGQVILYTMMMSELGKTVDSGLLLYLREGVMKEVPVGAGERRDLMLLRNELVTRLKASHRVVVSDAREIAPPVLPPPIHHHSACAKCPYLTLCSAALRVNGINEISEKNPLHQLSESSTSHLEMRHIVYVFHWTGLLRLEHTEVLLSSPSLHNIWTLPPAERAKRGSCIPKVTLAGRVVEVVSGSYQHVFRSAGDVTVGLTEGDYVIVSSAGRPAVAAGPVTQVSQSQLTLILERDLSTHQVADNVWYLDKYESQSGVVFNMTNLGCLLDSTEQAERLRRAVIDKQLPGFKPKLSSRVLKASIDLLSGLNEQQTRAIFRALAAEHYILIKGMPGTGKTATTAALVRLAVRLGLSVLVTSHTHSAVDNVLLRLLGHVDLLRLGSQHKLRPELAEYGENVRDFTSPDDLHAFYMSKSVVGVTCLGSSHPLLTRRKFDLCIVDEATQVLQPTVLRPLFSAHKFVLIGDPNQLPPLVRSSKAKELGLGESLFARLDRAAVTTELSLQYRMNKTITDLANCLTYGGRLQCGSTQVASATLSLPPSALEGEEMWVHAALGCSLEEAVVAVDTGESEAVACVNIKEADIVIQLLSTLTKGLASDKVGVIAPYRAQVDFLRQQVKSLTSLNSVEVNTVDQYQGRDKDVIIYSCTRSAKPTETDILGDKNRLTVAITRARHKLIIIGNIKLLRGYQVFDQLLSFLPSSCIVPIS